MPRTRGRAKVNSSSLGYGTSTCGFPSHLQYLSMAVKASLHFPGPYCLNQDLQSPSVWNVLSASGIPFYPSASAQTVLSEKINTGQLNPPHPVLSQLSVIHVPTHHSAPDLTKGIRSVFFCSPRPPGVTSPGPFFISNFLLTVAPLSPHSLSQCGNAPQWPPCSAPGHIVSLYNKRTCS